MARRKEEIDDAVGFSLEMDEFQGRITSQAYGATEDVMNTLKDPGQVVCVYSAGEIGPTVPSKISAKPVDEVHHSYAAQLKSFAEKEARREEILTEITSIFEEDQTLVAQDRTLWRNGDLTNELMDKAHKPTPRDCPRTIIEDDYSDEARP